MRQASAVNPSSRATKAPKIASGTRIDDKRDADDRHDQANAADDERRQEQNLRGQPKEKRAAGLRRRGASDARHRRRAPR